MKWIREETPQNPARLLIISSSEPFARALCQTLPEVSDAFIFSAADSISAILKDLAGRPTYRCVCIDTNIVFKEAPSEAGFAAACFCQHVRLTESLGELRLATLIVIHLRPLAWHLASAPETLFFCSPECRPVQVGESLATLYSILGAGVVKLDSDKLRQVNDFFVESDRLKRLTDHQYRNLTGPALLLGELAPDIFPSGHPDIIAIQNVVESDLVLKRSRVLNSGREPENIATEALQSLRSACRNHRFLMIDDDYEKGWAEGLFAGITGSKPVPTDGPDGTSFGNGMLRCLKTSEAAIRLIGKTAADWVTALKWFGSAKAQCETASKQLDIAARAKEVTQKQLAAKRNLLQTLKTELERAESAMQNAEASLKDQGPQLMETIAEIATDAKAPDELANLVGVAPLTKALMGLLRTYEDCKQSYTKVSENYGNVLKEESLCAQQAAEAAEKYKADSIRFQECTDNLSSAMNSSRKVGSEGIVLLDLNLAADVVDTPGRKDQLAQSGLDVLREIRACFPYLPVIVFTASKQAANLTKAMALGADGYWIKREASGRELASLIEQCVKKYAIHRLWLDLQLVKAKPLLRCKAFDKQGRMLDFELRPGRDRDIMERFLEQSCALLYNSLDIWFGKERKNILREVILDLGVIQEIRFAGAKEELWSKIPNPDELKWRQRRNSIAHDPVSVDFQEAYKFAAFTVDQLLK